MKIFALVTEDGTAMAETALCERHQGSRDLAVAAVTPTCGDVDCRDEDHARFASEDWNRTNRLVDCTGNEALSCIVCGQRSPRH